MPTRRGVRRGMFGNVLENHSARCNFSEVRSSMQVQECHNCTSYTDCKGAVSSANQFWMMKIMLTDIHAADQDVKPLREKSAIEEHRDTHTEEQYTVHVKNIVPNRNHQIQELCFHTQTHPRSKQRWLQMFKEWDTQLVTRKSAVVSRVKENTVSSFPNTLETLLQRHKQKQIFQSSFADTAVCSRPEGGVLKKIFAVQK
jgi:hypothetical protein